MGEGENAFLQRVSLTLSQTSSRFCCTSLIKTFPKQALVFTYLQYKFYENNAEKGEIALPHSVFYPFRELSTIFIDSKVGELSTIFMKFKIVVSIVFEFGGV